MPVVAMLPIEGRVVELVDDVQDEPGEMILREPVAQVRGQQEGLVAVTAQEVVSHGPFYCFTLFTPNAMTRTSQTARFLDRRHAALGVRHLLAAGRVTPFQGGPTEP
jgi:hypothetical protein